MDVDYTTECKNCSRALAETDQYCGGCGAKVVKARISLKRLISQVVAALGWNSNFFITLRHLLLKPELVFREYIGGTRKMYANPFSLFLIVTALSLFIFTQLSEQFIPLASSPYVQQSGILATTTDVQQDSSQVFTALGFSSEAEFKQGLIEGQLKYYNLIAFLFLPIYALIAFIVFRKPYNYGEHLVINTYAQSMIMVLSVVSFFLSLISGFNLFGSGVIIISFVYYCYAYQRLYRLSFLGLLLRILKFIGILLLLMLVPFLIGFVFASLF